MSVDSRGPSQCFFLNISLNFMGGQAPHTAIIGCADSRAPLEIPGKTDVRAADAFCGSFSLNQRGWLTNPFTLIE